MLSASLPTPRLARPAAPTTAVLALHDCGSDARQWRPVVNLAEPTWTWHLPDLLGHDTAWPVGRLPRLSFEVCTLLERLALDEAASVHVLGHGYGAVVALQMALQRPRQVRSLVLYEPLAFGVLAAAGQLKAWSEARAAVDELDHWLDHGHPRRAARVITTLLFGRDLWLDWNEAEQARWAAQARLLQVQLQAVFAAQWNADLLGMLQLPVTLICGDHTATCLTAVCEVLAQRLPHAVLRRAHGADHRTPLAQPARVACAMLRALDSGAPRLALPEAALTPSANDSRLADLS